MRRKTFRRALFLYGLILMILVVGALAVLWRFLENYQVTRLETTVSEYSQTYARTHSADNAGEFLAGLAGDEAEKADARAFIEECMADVVLKKNSAASSEERAVYKLISGEHTIGEATFERNVEAAFGLTGWSLTGERYDFAFLMGEYAVTVPEDYRVYVNGIALTEADVTARDIRFAALDGLYDAGYTLPSMVSYATADFLQKPRIRIEDKNGNEVTITDDKAENERIFLNNCSDKDMTRIEAFNEGFLPAYIAYGNNRGSSGIDQIKKLLPYLSENSGLKERMEKAIDRNLSGEKWQAKLTGTEILYMTDLGDGNYAVRVSYTFDTRQGKETVENRAAMRYILSDEDGTLKLDYLLSY